MVFILGVWTFFFPSYPETNPFCYCVPPAVSLCSTLSYSGQALVKAFLVLSWKLYSLWKYFFDLKILEKILQWDCTSRNTRQHVDVPTSGYAVLMNCGECVSHGASQQFLICVFFFFFSSFFSISVWHSWTWNTVWQSIFTVQLLVFVKALITACHYSHQELAWISSFIVVLCL